MPIEINDTVLYRTPMDQVVEAQVVGITENDENPDEPLLDLTLTDPTFGETFTVHEISAGVGMFERSPHTYTLRPDERVAKRKDGHHVQADQGPDD